MLSLPVYLYKSNDSRASRFPWTICAQVSTKPFQRTIEVRLDRPERNLRGIRDLSMAESRVEGKSQELALESRQALDRQ